MRRRPNLLVLGLSLSSSWGNGHAVTYRGLLKALNARGWDVTFLEREVPWYAGHRDLVDPDYCRLEFYRDLPDLEARGALVEDAEVVLVGSYVPEGARVADFVFERASGIRAFYDIDTPVTLAALEGGDLDYLRRDQIPRYDRYFSFTGGPTLGRLEQVFGSPAARALYCSADPELHRPSGEAPEWDLSYLGTYSDDRQPALERLLLEPARRAPHLSFMVAGPQYPESIAWPANVRRAEHVAPAEHARFYAKSRFTLNITREDMRRAGFSPSIRLFEAAACGAPLISDTWPGLETLFEPGSEILLADGPEAVLSALEAPEDARLALGAAARARVLQAHTAERRAEELETELRRALAERDPAPALFSRAAGA